MLLDSKNGRMNVKSFILRTAAALCAAVMCACGRRSDGSVTPPDGSLDSCTIRFSWWGGDDRHEATLKAIELWNTIHPEIEIVPEYGGWDGWSEKTAAQISGGTEPDIMQINYDWLVTMSPDGKGFYDLDELRDHLDLSGVDEDVLSLGRVSGHLNGAVVSITGRGLFYNSATYQSLGAEYPAAWDELFALGDKFRENDKYPLDLDIQSGGTAWYLAAVYVQQLTGREFISVDGRLGFTKDDIRTALDFYKRLEDEHIIRKVSERSGEDGNAALYQSTEFISGRIAGLCEWGSSVGKYEQVLPDGELVSGEFLSSSGNNCGWMVKPSMLYAVSAHTEHPDEAAAFMDFLLNNSECAEILGTTRGIPASQKAYDSLAASGRLTGLAIENDTKLYSMDTLPVSPYMELPRVKEFCNSAIESVSYSTCDTSEAAEELYDSITEYLEKIRK